MSRGRGRGRGRGKSFGGLEVLTILPGEAAPPPILQPPPLFPILDQKPLELRSDEIDNYMLSVKQDLRQFMHQSPFHLKVGSDKREIERYSDKYQARKLDHVLEWTPDWSFFPEELKVRSRKRKRHELDPKHKPIISSKRAKRNTPESSKWQDTDSISELLKDEADITPARQKKVSFSTEDDEANLSKKFEELERTEETEADNESGEDVWTGDDEYYDEEGQEEGTDYNMSYFDNGEQYGGDEDDALEEGPCY